MPLMPMDRQVKDGLESGAIALRLDWGPEGDALHVVDRDWQERSRAAGWARPVHERPGGRTALGHVKGRANFGEIPGGIGGMDFVYKIDVVSFFSEFVFRIYEDKALFTGYFTSSFEQGEGIFFQSFVIFF